MTPSTEVFAGVEMETARWHLLRELNALFCMRGDQFSSAPARAVYEYDATWPCEVYGLTYNPLCESGAVNECRSCKARKWLEDNPEVPA